MGIESSALWRSFEGKATSDQQSFVGKVLDCAEPVLNPAIRPPRSAYLSTQDFVE